MTKLFLGFLVVIFLNLFFGVVTSKLSDFNIYSSILMLQNKINNNILKIMNYHSTQQRSLLIFRELGKDRSAERFKEVGVILDKKIDSTVNYFDEIIIKQDSIDSHELENSGVLRETRALFDTTVKRNNMVFNKGFSSLVPALKQDKGDSKINRVNRIIDRADSNLVQGLARTDSLVKVMSKSRIYSINERIREIRRLTVFVLFFVMLFSIFFAFFFSRVITKHLRNLQKAAEKVAKGDFDVDLEGYRNDEIGDLAKSFFDMAYDLRDTQNELVRSKRMAAIGEVVASVNHEINNPLMVISGNAQYLDMMLDDEKDKEIKERIKVIIEESNRISTVTRKLREIKKTVVEDYTSSGEQMLNLEKSAEDDYEE